jgi:flagellar protein FliO/FliZ
MTSSLAPLLWFAAILVAIPVVLWLLKRTPIGSAGAQAGLRSVAVLALSPNQRIVTLEVGHGDARRWLVLGVSPAGISTLHEMAPQSLPDSGGEPGATSTSPTSPFAQALARLRAGGAPHGR